MDDIFKPNAAGSVGQGGGLEPRLDSICDVFGARVLSSFMKPFICILVLGILTGCAPSRLRLQVIDKNTGQAVPSATVTILRYKFSKIKSAGTTEVPLGPVTEEGTMNLKNLRSIDDVLVQADGYQGALVLPVDHNTVQIMSPIPPRGMVPLPRSVRTNSHSIIVPLEPGVEKGGIIRMPPLIVHDGWRDRFVAE